MASGIASLDTLTWVPHAGFSVSAKIADRGPDPSSVSAAASTRPPEGAEALAGAAQAVSGM
jgi:hypothetical protein